MSGNAFRATQDATKNIVVGAASDRVQVDQPGSSLRVYNSGTEKVWIKFGTDNTVTADVANDIPIGPGVTEVYSLPVIPGGDADLWVAAIALGATGTIYFTPGEGF